MATLINVGGLIMTPEQLRRALDEDMTVEETIEMIEQERNADNG